MVENDIGAKMNREKIMLSAKKALCFLPDKMYVKLYFRLRLHRKLNLECPVYLNDKLQWLKFNYRFPLQTIVSDKYAVRNYVADTIGDEYLIPLLGVWDSFDEIDFDELPDQFVLKCNHDSGGLAICTDKANFNKAAAKKKIEKSLKSNFYWVGREYQYKNIVPKIVCEQYITETGKVPEDYKIYCFNGEPDAILVCKDRFANGGHGAQYSYYDHKWNFLPYNKGESADNPPDIKKPENLDKMIEIAKELSKDFIFARIDLYNINGTIYFGEITLSPNSGFDPDITMETDKMFGDKLQIPYWKEIRSGNRA